jgi:hypothetical protein
MTGAEAVSHAVGVPTDGRALAETPPTDPF